MLQILSISSSYPSAFHTFPSAIVNQFNYFHCANATKLTRLMVTYASSVLSFFLLACSLLPGNYDDYDDERVVVRFARPPLANCSSLPLPFLPLLTHCGNRGLSTWQRQPPQLKRCGNSEEFTRPVPDSGNCLYLLCGLCRRDACKSLDAHYGNPSVKKLRSPIRRCHLSAVRHPGELRIWHSFICQSDEVDETTQLTIYFLTQSSSRTEVAQSRLSAPLP